MSHDANSSSLWLGTRTYLRPLRATDEAEFLAAARASRELRGVWAAPPLTSEAFAEYLAREDDTFRLMLVLRRSNDAFVGVYNLSQIFMRAFKSAYLGYYGFAATTRQGYMQEGLSLVLHKAFRELGLHRVEANIRPENCDSVALARRCGFQREGYSPNYLFLDGAWRDHERWAIREEIWSCSPEVSSRSSDDDVD
jgi:ribosomal-protein-alanine N-acetyltransferase